MKRLYLLIIFFSLLTALMTPRLVGQSRLNSSPAASLQVYPNPAESFIQFQSLESVSKVQIYSLLGQLVQEESDVSPEMKIDISKLQTGMYLVRFLDYGDEIIKTIRLNKK